MRFLICVVLAVTATSALAVAQAPPAPAAAPSIRNFLRVQADVCTGGQPRPEHFAELKAQGVRAVLNLRVPTEYAVDEELQAVKAAGLAYFNIPVVYRTPTFEQADQFLRITDDPANRPIFIHCTAAIRVAAFWMIRRVLRDNWTYDAAFEEAKKVGLVNAPHLEEFAKSYIARARGGV